MSTVDQKEIDAITTWRNFWWDENGPVRPLHEYNPLRLQFIKDELINNGLKIQNPDLPLENIRIVDIGCGGGIFTETLARGGARVTGIDASEDLINVAKDHIKLNRNISEKVHYIHTTVEDFARKESENSTYDAVVASEVLEHVSDPQLFLKECVKMLKPGKSIFVTTINRTLISWLSTIIAAEYIFKAIPRGIHSWNKFITPHEVECILKDYGCETRSVRGAKLNPMKIKWSWSSTLSTFYLLHAIKQKETSM
ncbi:Hexaprenyldihydroxybenzoate methyltransferase, mitochondrial [Cyphomyrmex costatus]|uniref:Ubiquinone biosynthesis O-methyltransferase, mitochondrial n=1 Tax=Cyphomyrmex costatus TaxID=456900 RepID=A0A195D742_9HYME|nr:Hexaprenyldihydroxybenzoate methyltransferase, mitochondrial [Cyphomyrmex costatus]